jgi:hypothetical protein
VFQKGDHTSLKRSKGNKMPMKHSSPFTSPLIVCLCLIEQCYSATNWKECGLSMKRNLNRPHLWISFHQMRNLKIGEVSAIEAKTPFKSVISLRQGQDT